MLLVRFALCCAMYHGLGRYLGVNGPKLDPSFIPGGIEMNGEAFNRNRRGDPTASPRFSRARF